MNELWIITLYSLLSFSFLSASHFSDHWKRRRSQNPFSFSPSLFPPASLNIPLNTPPASPSPCYPRWLGFVDEQRLIWGMSATNLWHMLTLWTHITDEEWFMKNRTGTRKKNKNKPQHSPLDLIWALFHVRSWTPLREQRMVSGITIAQRILGFQLKVQIL